ncbi:PLP-dependent cysteine synthase family protein [Rhizosphaericola mali]|uniref:cysteine synthase n=1 Tax=Rhizosphaericola mali TaxID=2545455 RepID=A0A5P2G0R2_9BACT|nr:cysteine synthase family protein [Rhizosphaericola mali]QES89396.1 cysteine synthase family protein [Rhizosphaericola mali]
MYNVLEKPTLAKEIQEKFERLWLLVGNTPMIEIKFSYKGKLKKIFAKCEHYNLTGSIKDRMALYILQEAYKTGAIQPGDTIVEATSGNTGISFSAIGRALGHDVKIIMPNWLSKERMDIIKSLGAEIILISKEEGGFLGSIALSEEMAKQPGVFLPKQFTNQYNCEAQGNTTGKELWEQLASVGLHPDAFVAGVGTGGTVMGVGNYLKCKNPTIKVHPMEPAESPTLSTGYKVGSHRIQGISDEFIPAIVELEKLDEIIAVNDGDAIIMAQKLSRELGLAVGISSGANFIAALKVLENMKEDAIVVTTFADSNKKYLSTALMGDEPIKENYLSTDIDLESFLPINRL